MCPGSPRSGCFLLQPVTRIKKLNSAVSGEHSQPTAARFSLANNELQDGEYISCTALNNQLSLNYPRKRPKKKGFLSFLFSLTTRQKERKRDEDRKGLGVRGRTNEDHWMLSMSSLVRTYCDK